MEYLYNQFLNGTQLEEITRRAEIDKKMGPLDSTKLYIGFEDPESIPPLSSRSNFLPAGQITFNDSREEVRKYLKETGFEDDQIQKALDNGCTTCEDAIDFITGAI